MSELNTVLAEWVGLISTLLWGKFLWLVILLAGLYLTVRLGVVQCVRLRYAVRQLWLGRGAIGHKRISPASALALSLSATVGTGNIVGVATAIGIGGPGALFWMWCSALLGMSIKYSEAVCAVQFREKNAHGHYVGGPMYYIKNGMGKQWRWLAVCFAIFAAFAGFGIGNAVQANSVADALEGAFKLDRYWLAGTLVVLVALVLLGGIKSIAKTAQVLVPIMTVLYIAGGLWVIAAHWQALPVAMGLIFESAFTGSAAQGGFAGAGIALAIQMGIARGIFSNEAGLGSAPIAHAAADNSPVNQGCIAMLGTFIDTIIICSVTGLAIIASGVWDGDVRGVAMSQAAFASAMPFGAKFVAVSISVFAFTTILGWSYYGERAAEFLWGLSVKVPYRVVWVIMLPVGVLLNLDVVWGVADILNGLMALPNILALLLLSGIVAKLTKEHFKTLD